MTIDELLKKIEYDIKTLDLIRYYILQNMLIGNENIISKEDIESIDEITKTLESIESKINSDYKVRFKLSK